MRTIDEEPKYVRAVEEEAVKMFQTISWHINYIFLGKNGSGIDFAYTVTPTGDPSAKEAVDKVNDAVKNCNLKLTGPEPQRVDLTKSCPATESFAIPLGK